MRACVCVCVRVCVRVRVCVCACVRACVCVCRDLISMIPPSLSPAGWTLLQVVVAVSPPEIIYIYILVQLYIYNYIYIGAIYIYNLRLPGRLDEAASRRGGEPARDYIYIYIKSLPRHNIIYENAHLYNA